MILETINEDKFAPGAFRSGPPTGFEENRATTLRQMRRLENVNADARNLSGFYDKLGEALAAREGRRWNSATENPHSALVNAPSRAGAGWAPPSESYYWAQVERIRREEPDALPGIPKNRDAMLAEMAQDLRTEKAEADDIAGRRTWEGFGGTLVGGFHGSIEDPVTIGTLPIGVSTTVLKTMVFEGLLGLAQEAAVTPLVVEYKSRQGIDVTTQEVINNILFAGGASALLGGAFAGAGKGVRHVLGTADRVANMTPEQLVLEALRMEARKIKKPTPDQKLALRELEAELKFQRANPFGDTPGGRAMHRALTNAALTDLIAGDDSRSLQWYYDPQGPNARVLDDVVPGQEAPPARTAAREVDEFAPRRRVLEKAEGKLARLEARLTETKVRLGAIDADVEAARARLGQAARDRTVTPDDAIARRYLSEGEVARLDEIDDLLGQDLSRVQKRRLTQERAQLVKSVPDRIPEAQNAARAALQEAEAVQAKEAARLRYLEERVPKRQKTVQSARKALEKLEKGVDQSEVTVSVSSLQAADALRRGDLDAAMEALSTPATRQILLPEGVTLPPRAQAPDNRAVSKQGGSQNAVPTGAGDRAVARFEDDTGMDEQIASLEADLRRQLAEDRDARVAFDVRVEGEEMVPVTRPVSEMLEELDADAAAVEIIKGCAA